MAFDLEAGSMATIGNLLEGISVWGTLDYKASTALHDVHDVDLWIECLEAVQRRMVQLYVSQGSNFR